MESKFQDKTILVTGAAGMLGSHVVDRLAELGAAVIATDVASAPDGFGAKPHDNVEVVNADILDRDLMRDLVARCDGVVHVAAVLTRIMAEQPRKGLMVNVVGTHDLLEFASEARLSRFVLASSGATYGGAAPDGRGLKESDPLRGRTYYAASKVASELFAEVFAHERALPYVSCRLATIYGPRLHPFGNVARYMHTVLAAAEAGDVPELPLDPNDSRDLVFVRDAAECLVRALVSDETNVAINVGSGRLTTNQEMFQALLEAAGLPTELTWRPDLSPVSPHGRFQDLSQTQRVIDYAPSTTVLEGMRELVQWRESLPAESRPNVAAV